MTKFMITANGTEMGVYEGATGQDAIDACCRDAGYRDQEHADQVTGGSDEFDFHPIAE